MIFRVAVRFAYPFIRQWSSQWSSMRNRQKLSAAIAVWHDGKLLVVRHSYLDGQSLPGGRMRRGETAFEAAKRELKEEVGITLDPREAQLMYAVKKPALQFHLFEYWPAIRPEIKVDNREITEATFLSPTDIGEPSGLLMDYLKRSGQQRP